MNESDKENKLPADGAVSEGASPILPPFGLAEDILGKVPKRQDESVVRPPKPGPGNGGARNETSQKYVTFFLDKEEYGLPISTVREINRVGEITKVPNTPEHVMGVINLRGKIVPVIELKSRLKMGKSSIGKESRIVVVEDGQKMLGLMVDRVSQVQNLSSGQIEEAPEEVVQAGDDFIKGVAKLDQRMIMLLELEKIVGQRNNRPV